MTIFSLPQGKRRCVKCGCIQDQKLIECINCGLNLKFVDSASELMPGNLAKKTVFDYLLKTQPFQTQGKFAGTVYLTPHGIFDFPSLGSKANIIYEHSLDYANISGEETMQTFYWERGSQHQSQIRTITYLPLLPLEKCIKCQKPATRFDVGEVSIVRGSLSFTMTGVSQELINRISTAWGSNRYWIPVPFCDSHKMETDTIVEVDLEENRRIIKTTSPEYSHEIAAFYKTPAKTTSMALRTRGCGAPALGFLGLFFLIVNGSTLFGVFDKSGNDISSIFSGEVLLNLMGLAIGIIMVGLTVRWLFVKPIEAQIQPLEIKPDKTSNIQKQPVGAISTYETTNFVNRVEVPALDPVEAAIKKGLSINTIVKEDIQLVETLKKSNAEKKVQALIAFMNRARNQVDSANDLVARKVETEAFRALTQAEGEEVIPALKQNFSRQSNEAMQAELINIIAEEKSAHSVHLLMEVAGTQNFRNLEESSIAFFNSMAEIARMNPEYLEPFLKIENVKKAKEISEINHLFGDIYKSLKICDINKLQSELNLPDTKTLSPYFIFTSLIRADSLDAKPTITECKKILKSTENLNSLYELLQSNIQVVRELARDLIIYIADEFVGDHVLELFISNPTSQQPYILSILSKILPDRAKLTSISAEMEKTFLESPTLELALLLAGLNSPLPIDYILLDLQKETREKHSINQDDEIKAISEFESRVKAKSTALLNLLQQNSDKVSPKQLDQIHHLEDPVFTSHYSSFIDGEEYDYVKKKTYSLELLRQAALEEIQKREK